MIVQLDGLCTQFPFKCPLTLIGVLSLNKFRYTEVTSVVIAEVDIVAISVYLELAVKTVAPLPNWFGCSFYSLDCVQRKLHRVTPAAELDSTSCNDCNEATASCSPRLERVTYSLYLSMDSFPTLRDKLQEKLHRV